MLTYVGKGYSPAFTANYDKIAARISQGEEIVFVSGPDDICAPLLCETDCHCHNESVTARDGLAAQQVGHLLAQSIAPGTKLTFTKSRLQTLRAAFSGGEIRSACKDCEWQDLCDDVAATGFHDTRIAAS